MSRYAGLGQGPDPDGTGIVDPGFATPTPAVYTAPPGFVGPISPEVTGGAPVVYPASQTQIADLQSQLNAMAPAPGSFSAWMNQNGGTVMLIGIAFVGLMLLSKHR